MEAYLDANLNKLVVILNNMYLVTGGGVAGAGIPSKLMYARVNARVML